MIASRKMFVSLFCASSALLLLGEVGNAIQTECFYNFGKAYDSSLPRSDDVFSAISLPLSFSFFNSRQINVFVNDNGILSFGKPVKEFIPKRFPIGDGLQIIAPFWADVDTSRKGKVWYKLTPDESLLSIAKDTIRAAFSNQMSFEPRMLFIVTWDHVGHYRNRTCLTNTFQCVLVTDGSATFAIFNYADGEMQWTTGDASGGRCGLGGAAAQVGFNAGDGIRFKSVQHSRTNRIINITSTTNVNISGVWIFRVDEKEIISPDRELDSIIVCPEPTTIPPMPTTTTMPPTTTTPPPDCPTESDFSRVRLSITPRFGIHLGGTAIHLQGPCFMESDEIRCLFDSKHTRTGIVLDYQTAVCVSPRFGQAGWKNLTLMVVRNEQPVYIGETTFYTGYPEDTDNINVTIGNDNSSLLLVNGSNDKVMVKWNPRSLLPLLDPNLYQVNISLHRLENNEWKSFLDLEPRHENNGVAEFLVPTLSNEKEKDIYPVAIRISVLQAKTSESEVLKFAEKNNISLWKTDLFYRSANASELFDLCIDWARNSSGIGEKIRSRVSCCSETQKKAALPNSGFVRDRRDELVAFLHPGADTCYQQETITSNNSGSGQQCCYDRNGSLITGPNSGGTADLVAPKGDLRYETYYKHLLEDIIPAIYCCKAEYNSATCSVYYQERPSHKAEACKLPSPGFSYGDPHFVTMDGFNYTFNGYGEFVLIETVNDIFTLQGRMVPMRDDNGEEVSSSFYSAVVGRQFDSDTVQFQLGDNDEIDVLINGELVDFKDLAKQQFNNVVLKKSANSISAVFSSGVHIKAKAAHEMISGLLVSLPNNSYYWNQTSGLLGNYNGNKSDDLIPRGGTDTISNTSTMHIHNHFAKTWIVSRSEDSLFTYSKGEDWSIYYWPDFVPVYDTRFVDLDLEMRAKNICGNYSCCMFDMAATGRDEIGQLTVDEFEYFLRIIKNTTLPVVCEPPCVNGVCVKNNTCRCSEGFSGDTCKHQNIKECEESMIKLCENREGTCKVEGGSMFVEDTLVCTVDTKKPAELP